MTMKVVDGIKTLTRRDGTRISVPVVGNAPLWNWALGQIEKNNTWCPSISRVIFNVKTDEWKRDKDGKLVKDKNGQKISVKLDSPVLATTVEFCDRTKATVQNSENDAITIVKDPRTGVMTASDADKERAIVYAVCKKLFGSVDEKGEVQGNGFGRKLRQFVENGWDQRVQEKLAENEKAVAKKSREDKKAAPAKKRRMSLAEAMVKLGETIKEVEELKAQIASAKPAAGHAVKRNAKSR